MDNENAISSTHYRSPVRRFTVVPVGAGEPGASGQYPGAGGTNPANLARADLVPPAGAK